jgi:RNA polymerase sigma-70 factor (ECF subfamily)
LLILRLGLEHNSPIIGIADDLHATARKVLGHFTSYRTGEQRHVTSEHTLLERARAYDADALGELYDQYAPLIYAYLYRRVRDAQLAEDLTGEVFVRVLQAIQSEQFWHTSFRGWLYRIAHNLLVDHYRKQPPAPMLALDEQLVAAQGDPDSALAEKLSHQDLLAAISQLTLNQQQVLVLRFGEQLAAREVAEIMGKSVGAVEVLQHRALTALRRLLRKNEPW